MTNTPATDSQKLPRCTELRDFSLITDDEITILIENLIDQKGTFQAGGGYYKDNCYTDYYLLWKSGNVTTIVAGSTDLEMWTRKQRAIFGLMEKLEGLYQHSVNERVITELKLSLLSDIELLRKG